MAKSRKRSAAFSGTVDTTAQKSDGHILHVTCTDVVRAGSLFHIDVAASLQPLVAAVATFDSKDVAASWNYRWLCETMWRHISLLLRQP